MRPGTPGFVGLRLIEAREARGLTGVALAELLGVSPQSITYYEQGKATPHPEVMTAISAKLNLPTSYFMRPAFRGDDANIFWRSTSSATKTARNRAEKRLVWLKEMMSYLREYFDFPAVNLPTLPTPSDFRSVTGEQIEEIAGECRKFWGLGNGPIPDVLAELEANGIITCRINVNVDNLDAFSQWSNYDFTPYIVLGVDKASSVRTRFDAAHELAHLILHQKVDKKRLNTAADFKILEDQAHRFASAFLMPAASFTKEVWAASLDTFAAVKQRWGASIAAMIMRCRYLGVINEDHERRLWINLNRRGWRKEEPYDNTIEHERPRLLRRAIEMLVAEKVCGVDQILLQCRLSPADLEEIAGLDPGYLKSQQVISVPFPRLRDKEMDAERLTTVVSGTVVCLEAMRKKK